MGFSENTVRKGIDIDMVVLRKSFAIFLMIAFFAAPGLCGVTEPLVLEIKEETLTLMATFTGDELCIRNGTEIFQRIPCDEETAKQAEACSMECISLIDMNFDGFPDLQILESLGSVNAYYACYLWNPESGLFEENEPLGEIANPTFHEDTKEISAFFHVNAMDNMESLSAWRNGELVMLWCKTQNYVDHLNLFEVTEERLNDDGVLENVFERHFTEKQMERYLQGELPLEKNVLDLMGRAAAEILGSNISGDPRFHGEYFPEGQHMTAWLVDLENGDLACFEVPDDGLALYLNKGGDNGTFRINFGKKATLGKRLN